MACTSCGAGGPGFFSEHFTDAEAVKAAQVPKSNPFPIGGNMPQKVPSACPAKNLMNNCIYTTQGMFVCNVENKEEGRGVAQNDDMMRETMRDQRMFYEAAPWDMS